MVKVSYILAVMHDAEIIIVDSSVINLILRELYELVTHSTLHILTVKTKYEIDFSSFYYGSF